MKAGKEVKKWDRAGMIDEMGGTRREELLRPLRASSVCLRWGLGVLGLRYGQVVKDWAVALKTPSGTKEGGPDR